MTKPFQKHLGAKAHSSATPLSALSFFLLTGCISAPIAPQIAKAQDRTVDATGYADPATLDPSVPTPQSVIGHLIGDGAVRYDAMIAYLKVLDDASPLITLTPYATTHEGRRCYFLTITSERNHGRLDQIKADNQRIADPRKLDDPGAADRIIESLPGVAWMAYSIHGDELSGCDAAVQAAYQLTAGTDEATRRLRDELVIHIDPLQNPDGRERYLGQLQHLTGKTPNPDDQAMQHTGFWSAGRGNHYLFDLNRDWLMMVHPETRGRAARILEWNPHLVVDGHEMGSRDTFLFDPPREPYNINLSENNMKWRRRFSADQAKAFDRHGWSYYTQEWYEEWYPGYTNAWGNLHGAVGILYEQAGVNAALVKQAAGTVLTYREAVHHQLTSTMANLETLRAHREEILRDYFEDRKWAVASNGVGAREVFLLAPHDDRARRERFLQLLRDQAIEFSVGAEPFAATSVTDSWGRQLETWDAPAGTVVVRSAQPHRRLLHAILGFDPRMSDAFLLEERKNLENHRGSRLYDVTAWNLGMAYGLEAYWAASVSPFATAESKPGDRLFPQGAPAYGYLVDGRSGDIHRLVAALLGSDVKIRVARKPFTIEGHSYHAGSLLVRNHENPENLRDLVARASENLLVDIHGAATALSQSGPDLGGNEFDLLENPRIAIASQWPIGATSFGAVWHLLDERLALRSSPVNVQSLGSLDLRRYNVIVLPNAWGSALKGVLNEPARNQLKQWVQAGGTLIAMGSSAAFLADPEVGLSGVRQKSDVLDKHEEYEEALQREQAARNISVDPTQVWGIPRSEESPMEASSQPDVQSSPLSDGSQDNEGGKSGAKTEGGDRPQNTEKLKRLDEWQRIFSPQGVFASAVLDREHWLCFGLDERLPTLISGSQALMARHPVAIPARLVDEDQIRLSGLMWPEARERWANTAYATVERVGRGQVILFAGDPIFRGYLEGSGRMLMNAMIFGPGLGASQTVPW